MTKEIDFNSINDPMAGPRYKDKANTTPAIKNPFDLAKVQEAFEPYMEKIQEMRGKVEALEITDEDSLQLMVEMAAQLKKLEKTLETQRLEIVDQPTKFTRSVNAFVKQFKDELAKAVFAAKVKIGADLKKKQAAAQEAQKKADEEAARQQAKLTKQAKDTGIEPIKPMAPVIPIAKDKTRTEEGLASTAKRWVWKIKEDGLEVIPREYLQPDSKALNEAVKAGVRDIPGVDIFEETSVKIRTT